jgi:HK97 family phage prohead protease
LDFKLYTNALKAFESPSGDHYVTGTTSSTIKDLHGDSMTMNALKSMEQTAKQNLTVFLNHNYEVPQDLFGSVKDARIVKRWDEEAGQEVYDLDIDIRVVGEDENPLAMKTYRAIKRGVKLGLSIGARVNKVQKAKDAMGEDTYIIDEVALLESSVVGIPANQRSYLQNALKSLRGGAERSEGDDLSGGYEDAKAASKLAVGDMVSWGSSGGRARGKIVRVVRTGTVSIPDSSFTITAEENDPAVLIRVYDGDKPTDRIVGHKMSTLRATKSFDDVVARLVEIEGHQAAEKNETEDSTSAELEKNMTDEELIEKKTRVTVTVSTDGTESTPAPAAAAAPATPAQAEVGPEDEDDMDAIKASIEPDVKPEVGAEVAEETESEEEAAPSTTADAVTALQNLGAVLVRSGEAERKYIAQGLIDLARDIVPGDDAAVEVVAEEPEVAPEAPIVETDAPAVEAEVEVAAVAVEAQAEVVEEAKSEVSIAEIESIAKSALDSAIAAQQEVGELKERLTELQDAKIRVEQDMEKAIGLIGQILDHGVGRKSVTPFTVKTPEAAPWLSPYVRRTLETQE